MYYVIYDSHPTLQTSSRTCSNTKQDSCNPPCPWTLILSTWSTVAYNRHKQWSHGSPIERCKQANSQFKKPHMANSGLIIMLHFSLLLKYVYLVVVRKASWNSSLEGDFVPIRQTTATVIVKSSVLNNNHISPPQNILVILNRGACKSPPFALRRAAVQTANRRPRSQQAQSYFRTKTKKRPKLLW